MPPPELETPAGAPLPAPGDGPADDGEPAAWAAVIAAWSDDEAHRAYLTRFGDLEGLARAGGRYREVLAARPGDPVALRFRDEVVKRATVQGLALLPRTTPRAPSAVARKVVIAACVVFGSAAAFAVFRLAALLLHPGAP